MSTERKFLGNDLGDDMAEKQAELVAASRARVIVLALNVASLYHGLEAVNDDGTPMLNIPLAAQDQMYENLDREVKVLADHLRGID